MITIPCDYCGEEKQIENKTDVPTIVELTGAAASICDKRGFLICAGCVRVRLDKTGRELVAVGDWINGVA